MRKIDVYAYDNLPESIKNIIRKREDDWQNWDDEQLVAFMYTQLGMSYSYDPNYMYADLSKKAQIELEAEDLINFRRRLSNRFVNCIDLANALEMTLQDVFGIPCKTVVDGSGPHKYNIVYLPKKVLKLSLQEDLSNIQSGRKLEYFGCESYYDGRSFTVYTDSERDAILTSIGYPGIPYTNHLLDSYSERMKKENIPLSEKLEIILLATSLEYEQFLSRMGYCEKIQLFKDCISDHIPLEGNMRKRGYRSDDEISHITINKSGKFVSCFSIRCEDGKQKHYINDGLSLKYNEIDDQSYKQLVNQRVGNEAQGDDFRARG